MYQIVDDYSNVLTLDNRLSCSINEDYKQNPIFAVVSYKYQKLHVGDEDLRVKAYEFDVLELNPAGSSQTGRNAILLDDPNAGLRIANAKIAYGGFAGESKYLGTDPPQVTPFSNQQYFPYLYNTDPDPFESFYKIAETNFSTNIPVFAADDVAHYALYLSTPDDNVAAQEIVYAKNFDNSQYDVEHTSRWHYYGLHGTAKLFQGAISPIGTPSDYKSFAMKSNKPPALYRTGNGFELALLYDGLLSSVFVPLPSSNLEAIPETEWRDDVLTYDGPFYIPANLYMDYFKECPPDGNYNYNFSWNCNIPVFPDRASAEDAIINGNYSGAVNYSDINDGNTIQPPEFGDGGETEFGGGGFISPFSTILAGSLSDIRRLKDFLFSDDETIITNIKKGLELYGSNPIDWIVSCKAYGFNTNLVSSQSTRYDIFFGSYMKHFDSAFNEVINLSTKYINAGTFRLDPWQFSYKDLEPYSELSAYFPYHGWEKLDIKKYYKRSVNIRYYVDIISGQALIVTLTNDAGTLHICDIFGPCEVGTELPITGSNYAQWAQGQMRFITNSASSLIGGAAQGATSGGMVGAAVGLLGGGIQTMSNLYEMKQKGSPKNTAVTKGNFSAQTGNYMPGRVIIRLDVHNMLEPANLTGLYGKPSYSSGQVKNFSGFLKCEKVKLNTAGMTDAEAERIINKLHNGIYI